MKSKIPLLAVVVFSTVLLSACGAATEQSEQLDNQQPAEQQQGEIEQRPSGEPGKNGSGMDKIPSGNPPSGTLKKTD